MAQVLRLDLANFSTKALSQVAADAKLYVYTQKKDYSDKWNLGKGISLYTDSQ